MRRIIPLVLIGLVVTAFALGHTVRGELDIEFDAESIRAWVATLGWQAPVIYVGLVTFRQFLLLPSAIVLPVGGLCFGALAGTALGAAGIVISALMKFGVARAVGRDWVRGRLPQRFWGIERRIETAGPVAVGLTTAHPLGLMAPIHWAAGLTSIPVTKFAIAVAIGGPVRAGAYSFLGATLLNPWSARFYLAAALLLAVIVSPAAHPGLRRRIFGEAESIDVVERWRPKP